jgi:hypothetical protein
MSAPAQASTSTAKPATSSTAQSTNSNDPRLSGIVSNVVALVQNRTPPTTANILSYAVEIMQNVERFVGLTGDQKSQVLQSAITTIINGSNLPPLEKEALQTLASVILPEFSRIVCLASKGILDINKKIEAACSNCWGKC